MVLPWWMGRVWWSLLPARIAKFSLYRDDAHDDFMAGSRAPTSSRSTGCYVSPQTHEAASPPPIASHAIASAIITPSRSRHTLLCHAHSVAHPAHARCLRGAAVASASHGPLARRRAANQRRRWRRGRRR